MKRVSESIIKHSFFIFFLSLTITIDYVHPYPSKSLLSNLSPTVIAVFQFCQNYFSQFLCPVNWFYNFIQLMSQELQNMKKNITLPGVMVLQESYRQMWEVPPKDDTKATFCSVYISYEVYVCVIDSRVVLQHEGPGFETQIRYFAWNLNVLMIPCGTRVVWLLKICTGSSWTLHR